MPILAVKNSSAANKALRPTRSRMAETEGDESKADLPPIKRSTSRVSFPFPSPLSECLREGKTKPDYTLNPYYLRLDVDGDGEMDYVTFISDNSGPFRISSLQLVEEAAHHTAVSAAGVGIGDPCAEELIGGKESVAAGALKDGRDRSVGIEGPGGG